MVISEFVPLKNMYFRSILTENFEVWTAKKGKYLNLSFV